MESRKWNDKQKRSKIDVMMRLEGQKTRFYSNFFKVYKQLTHNNATWNTKRIGGL